MIKQRNQVSQLRLLLDAFGSATAIPLPNGCTVHIGVSHADAPPRMKKIEDFIADVYQHDRDVNEVSISSALARLLELEAPKQRETKQFSRRHDSRTCAHDSGCSADVEK